MLFTRECDYAVRIMRALSDGKTLNVQKISECEDITTSITYKIARKLERAGYIRSYRGTNGGYALNMPLEDISLYEIFTVIDRDLFITSCTNSEFSCSRNTHDHKCMVHQEFLRLQSMIEGELKSKKLSDVME